MAAKKPTTVVREVKKKPTKGQRNKPNRPKKKPYRGQGKP